MSRNLFEIPTNVICERLLFESGLRFTQVCPCMRFTQVCPCVNKRVSRLRGGNVSCIHLSCQENCWRVVNSMGKLMFVSDNRNQLTKLENFGEMFSFSRKEKQDDCFFLNKRNCKKENFLLNIRRGSDSYRIKASKHGS